MKQHLVVLLTAALVFAGAGVARAESILLVDFERPGGVRDRSGPWLGTGACAPGRHRVHSVPVRVRRESVRGYLLRVVGRERPRAAAGIA